LLAAFERRDVGAAFDVGAASNVGLINDYEAEWNKDFIDAYWMV
jgi:hypothetical protein